MHRVLTGGLLSAFIVLGLSSGADAQVERSGNTFHKRVCNQVVGHVARCHAHVVTDAAGHLHGQHGGASAGAFGI